MDLDDFVDSSNNLPSHENLNSTFESSKGNVFRIVDRLLCASAMLEKQSTGIVWFEPTP